MSLNLLRSGLVLLLVSILALPAQLFAAEIPPTAVKPAPAPTYHPLTRSAQATPVVYCYHGVVPDPRLVVVDKSRQRLLVFQYLGQLGLEYEYPCASGEQQGKKSVSADKRTPEGVYFITHRFKDRKITIFGDRALHLNYPNASDQTQGRKGDGIYIHGSNVDFKSRSSNGCLVLSNQDLARVEPMIREQSTPVILVDRLDLPTLAEREQACEFLRTLDLSLLASGQPRLPDELSLIKNQAKGADLKALAQDLSRLGSGPAAKTEGLALWGVGDQWVLVLHQTWGGAGNRKKVVSVSRRFYLEGPTYQKLQVVQRQWVVADLPQARLLASWAPPKPVVVAARRAPAPAGGPEQQITKTLGQWLAAWQSKRLRQYMTFYAKDFKGGGRNWRQWRRHKAYLNRVYKKIEVKLLDLQIKVSGGRATVTFVQDYSSDHHRDKGYKTIHLVERQGRWQIQREDWRAIETAPAKPAAPPRS